MSWARLRSFRTDREASETDRGWKRTDPRIIRRMGAGHPPNKSARVRNFSSGLGCNSTSYRRPGPRNKPQKSIGQKLRTSIRRGFRTLGLRLGRVVLFVVLWTSRFLLLCLQPLRIFWVVGPWRCRAWQAAHPGWYQIRDCRGCARFHVTQALIENAASSQTEGNAKNQSTRGA